MLLCFLGPLFKICLYFKMIERHQTYSKKHSLNLPRITQLYLFPQQDNADLCQSPSQKLCVEIDNLIEKVQLILKLDSYNHQAPLIATSQLNQGTQSSLQPWSQLTRKRALLRLSYLSILLRFRN